MFRLNFAILALVAALAAPAGAGVGAPATGAIGEGLVTRIVADEAAGALTPAQSLLYRLALGFAPATLPPTYRPAGFAPLKCATPLVAEYLRARDGLPPEVVATVEGWLAGAAGADKAGYVSPGGRFHLTYDTTGPNAVPPADVSPADGVPDFVQRIAGYLDAAWALQVDSLGFTAPPVGTGRYEVGFQDMAYYGYTTPLGGGLTRITLHNDFLGFPPNTDPEGNQWGAAKVTVAHEFKHASQYPGSAWSEGAWVEIDATWMEDVAYDQVNDYYNYLGDGNPITDPGLPLGSDYQTTGLYEDCIWQHWLSETWGTAIVRDYWEHRKTHQLQTPMESYQAVLQARGTSLAEGWPRFAAWNYATGTRAATGLGYGEAPFYPTGPTADLSVDPETVAGAVPYLSAAFVRHATLDPGPGWVKVRFLGADGATLGLTAVILLAAGGGVFEPIALDAANDADVYLSVRRERIAALGFVVANGQASPASPARAWALTLDQVVAAGAPLLQVSVPRVARELPFGATERTGLAVVNAGDPGSVLAWTAAVEPAVPWLRVEPTAGRLAAGEAAALALTLDATWLAPGAHETTLLVGREGEARPEAVPVTLTVTAASDGAPYLLRLRGNRPNPFNPATTVEFSLPRAGWAELAVFDLRGRPVRVLWRGEAPAGPSTARWDGRDEAGREAPAGAYLLRLQGPGGTARHKMQLTK